MRRSVTRWPPNVGAGLAIGVAVAVLAEPLVSVLSPGANVSVMRALALSIAIYGLSIVPLALLQKALLFKRHAAANAGAATIASIVAVVAIVLGAGVWALVARQILFQALLSAFAWISARRLFPAAEPGTRQGRGARPPGASSLVCSPPSASSRSTSTTSSSVGSPM